MMRCNFFKENTNSLLEYFEYFCQKSPKLFLIIASYTVSNIIQSRCVFSETHSINVTLWANVYGTYYTRSIRVEYCLKFSRYAHLPSFMLHIIIICCETTVLILMLFLLVNIQVEETSYTCRCHQK